MFPFLHILTNIYYLWSFWWLQFQQVWGDTSLCIWFAVIWWLTMFGICSCSCCPSVYLLCKNVYSGLLCISFNQVVCFLILSCMCCLYTLDLNLLYVILFADIFSHSVGCLFIFMVVFFMISFAVQKLLSFIRSH